MVSLSRPRGSRDLPQKTSSPVAEGNRGRGEGIQRKKNQVSLIVLMVCLLNCWIILEAVASSGQRDPFAFPPGVKKGEGLQKKVGADPGKAGQESAPGFRVTTILVSGRTKVAAINGVLMKKGDKLDGYQILEIEDKQVILSRGKEKLVLKIDSDVGYSFKKLNTNHQIMGFQK